MKKATILFLYICLFLLIQTIEAQDNNSISIHFDGIKKDMFWINKPDSFSLGKDNIFIQVPKKTDLFCSADGWVKVHTAPRLLFQADSQFIFKAKIASPLINKWDGAVLVVESDQQHWAKLCFEKDYLENKRIVSVFNNVVSDDCNSEKINDSSVYLEISRKGGVIYFYYSSNGEEWYLLRNFKFPFSNIKVGFLVQSPAGNGNYAEFSEISYKAVEMQDFWKGK